MILLTSILAHAEEPAPLVLPIWAFPLIAAVFFVAVGVVTFLYRNVANRHSDKVGAHDGGHGDGAGH